MTTNYKGINYGTFDSNRNPKTGIRFGVISQNEVLQAWADSSEPQFSVHCPYCGSGPLKKGFDAKRCPHCYKALDESDFYDIEPDGYLYEEDGYACSAATDGDIFVCKSPYFTYAQFCSPCAPGACHLENPLDEPSEDNKCYCFGHDWFDSGKAPYKVYSVKTGEEVLPS